ncbi:MAG: hypothetical protein ACLFUJ_14660 [Phycisphaerae bacterium]
MAGDNYYYLTALTPPADLGAPLPITQAELLSMIRDNADAAEMVAALFLGDDLVQMQAMASGELETPVPAVLSPAQVSGEMPLPDSLEPSGQTSPRRIASDAVWEAYYRHLGAVAEKHDSRFLKDWVGFEVALRNALVSARAAGLGIEPSDYTVAVDLADPHADVDDIVKDWSAASDPLAGLRVLDRGRWQWLHENDQAYAFTNDELVAYAAKLMLAARWLRLTEAEDDAQGPAA